MLGLHPKRKVIQHRDIAEMWADIPALLLNKAGLHFLYHLPVKDTYYLSAVAN